VVVVDEDPDQPSFSWSVRLDYRSAMLDLLARLSDEGANDILLLSGTEDNAWNRLSQCAYLDWCAERRSRPRLHQLYEGEGREGAHELMAPLLAAPDRPDAVIAAASRFAAGVADAADLQGLRLPDDVMVAALTDSAFSREHTPPITAVDLRLEDLGREAVELLLARLAGQPAPTGPITLAPHLRWRDSTSRRR
jgi:DNA-binding LacI/PurR family transcriptional regulator